MVLRRERREWGSREEGERMGEREGRKDGEEGMEGRGKRIEDVESRGDMR